MARYRLALKDKALARLLAPENAALHVVAQDLGVGVSTALKFTDPTCLRAGLESLQSARTGVNGLLARRLGVLPAGNVLGGLMNFQGRLLSLVCGWAGFGVTES